MKTVLILATLLLAAPAYGHGDKHAEKPPAAAPEEQAFGRPGDPKKVAREVLVTMGDDMRFRPGAITVRQGETVRFRVKNNGKVMHELVLGTLQDLKDHAEMMKKHPGMEHDEPHMVHVAPGKTGTLVWQFTRAGAFHFGCLVAGHFEAGMVGALTVTSYAGEEKRELKSLSAEEVEQYRAGAGMGYAKSAELNHFPGPMHALELADRIELSAAQQQATQALMAAHKAEARAIGAKLVEAEARIEALFRKGNPNKEQLEEAVKQAATLQGEYRLSHLETHRRMRALLTPEQVSLYDDARGYLKTSSHASNHDHAKAPPKPALAEGEVRRVDKDAQKLTIRHGPLPQLDMPHPMTMVYRVKDPALLDQVKAGDKVTFEAEKVNGAFVVTRIEAAK